MKRLALPLFAALLAAAPAVAEETADQIIERLEKQPTPDSSAVQMKMTLIQQRGGKQFSKERSVEIFAKRADTEGARSLLKFTAPADVKGVSLLVRQNKGSANEQFLYMPALRGEPKRIAGGDRNQSFLGTDFTFADLEGLDRDTWTSVREADVSVDGKPAWVIVSTPQKPQDGDYAKVVQTIRQDILLPVRVEFYDAQGLLKVLTVEETKQIDGFWIAVRTRMENVRRKSATVLEILQQRNNLEIPDSVFTTREMKKG